MHLQHITPCRITCAATGECLVEVKPKKVLGKRDGELQLKKTRFSRSLSLLKHTFFGSKEHLVGIVDCIMV